MIDHSRGKIFLAGERGLIETDWFRSCATFNFGKYQSPYKKAVGPLYVLNDDTLAGGSSMELNVADPTDVLLLPVVGAITYKDDVGQESLIMAGQAQLHSIAGNSAIQIGNPFETDLVNYVQLWLKREDHKSEEPNIRSFDVNSKKNQLIELFTTANDLNNKSIKISIGKFSGRAEVDYSKATIASKVFVFVLEGAFEVQYRLLESRDGLALENVETVEIEALSNDAILIVVEML